MKILLMVMLFGLSASTDYADSVFPLAKGEIAISSDHKYKCWVDYSNPKYNVLILEDGSKKIEVWRCVKSVGVSFSENSQYLAVEDYLDGLSSAVLIFKIYPKSEKVELIYQSPYSNSSRSHFSIGNWSGEKFLFLSEGKKASSLIKVDLSGLKPIAQTIYRNE